MTNQARKPIEHLVGSTAGVVIVTGDGDVTTTTDINSWTNVLLDYVETRQNAKLDVYPTVGGEVITLPDPSTLNETASIDVYNQADTSLSILVKDHLGATLETIIPGHAYSFYFTGKPFVEWTKVHTQGLSTIVLDAATYGNFNSIAWGNLSAGTYNIMGNGSQFSNYTPEYVLQPAIPYLAEVEIRTTPDVYEQGVIFTSGFDFTNPILGLERRRTGITFDRITATNWSGEKTDNAHLLATSTATVVLNNDPNAPSFLGPLSFPSPPKGFEIFDAATGAVKNTSGRVLNICMGSISFNPDKSGGGTATIHLVSERSDDNGATWYGNLPSKRTIELRNNTESFGSKVSFAVDWQPDQIIRFRAYVPSGNVSFVSTSQAMLGETYYTPSIIWALTEA